jgi:hypothetical protein
VVVGEPEETDLVISDGSGTRCSVLLEAAPGPSPRAIQALTSGLSKRLRRHSGLPPVLVVLPFIGLRDRELLRSEQISYLDLTGNIRFVLDSPAVFVEADGAKQDPNTTRPAVTLRGAKVGAMVRTLIDVRPPYTAAEVAEVAGVNQGYVSRVLEGLTEEGLLERSRRGPITEVDWVGLIRQRARQIDLFGRAHRFVSGEGHLRTLNSLARDDSDVLITGSFAAARLAPIEPVLLIAYTNQPRELARRHRLTAAKENADVLLVRPDDATVYRRTGVANNLSFAAPSQVAMDCLGDGGQMADHGEAVITWMERNEGRWRSQSIESHQRDRD